MIDSSIANGSLFNVYIPCMVTLLILIIPYWSVYIFTKPIVNDFTKFMNMFSKWIILEINIRTPTFD